MTIEKNKVVSIHYTLKNDSGETIDSSEGKEPLVYLHGTGQLLPKLEERLEGAKVADSFDLKISAEDGYGEHNAELIQKVDKDNLKEIPKLEVGMQLQADTPQGKMILMITEINDDHVVLDANHPLAGVGLNFSVKVVECRDATKDELAHGHAHPHGDDHLH